MTISQPEKPIEQVLGLDHAAGRSRRLGLWVGGVALLLALAGGVFFFLARDTADAVAYRQQAVGKGDLTITVTATGTLEPTNQVDVGVEVSGTIKTVDVDYNVQVRKGQVLARLDTSKLSAQVLQSRAAREAARAREARAQADVKQAQLKLAQFRRARRSSGGRIPSQVEMDAAEAALARANADAAIARADIAKASAELEFNQTNLSKAIIRSPIDGIVLVRHVDPGQTVAASLQTPVLFTLAEDLRKMDLHVDVDEADVGRVRVGQEATFGVDAYPRRRFTARVVQLRFAPKTVAGVVTYETVLSVDNRDLALMPGMTATADIVVRHIKDVLLVPNAALRFAPPRHRPASKKNRGLLGALLPHRRRPSAADKRKKRSAGEKIRSVWVLRDGKPFSVPLKVGETDGRWTEVRAGDIALGQQVLTGMLQAEK